MRLPIVFTLLLTAAGSAFAEPPVRPPMDRNAQPLHPPRPIYPAAAVSAGLSGACNVYLDVTAEGKPINLKADCTDPVFVQSAEDAMHAVVFPPKIVDGQPAPREGVIYPIEYDYE